jgi:hypothetical protein
MGLLNKLFATTVEIPKCVKSIDQDSIEKYHYKNAKRVVLPSTLEEIGSYAFRSCEYLEEIVVPEGVEKIGEYAFVHCTSLKRIVLPSTLKELGVDMTSDCENIREIDITKVHLLKVLPSSTFQDLKHVQEIAVPEGVEKICENAFYNCPSLKKVVLPSTLKEMKALIIKCCDNLKELDMSKVHLLKVLPYGTFRSKYVQEIVVPEGVEKIGKYAFYSCANLRRIVMPSTLKEADGPIVDNECKNLKEIDLSKVKVRPTGIFYDLKEKQIEIPKGVEKIGKDAFYSCANLRKIVMPSTLKELEGRIFYDCDKLEEIDMSKVHLLKELPEDAFCNWKNVKQIEIPEGVEKIGKDAFYRCANLRKIVMPSTLKELEERIFYDCDKLKEIDTSKIKGQVKVGHSIYTCDEFRSLWKNIH